MQLLVIPVLALSIAGPNGPKHLAASSECPDSSDSNDDGKVDICDVVTTLEALYLGKEGIPAPGTTSCGVDPSLDGLGCSGHKACP